MGEITSYMNYSATNSTFPPLIHTISEITIIRDRRLKFHKLFIGLRSCERLSMLWNKDVITKHARARRGPFRVAGFVVGGGFPSIPKLPTSGEICRAGKRKGIPKMAAYMQQLGQTYDAESSHKTYGHHA